MVQVCAKQGLGFRVPWNPSPKSINPEPLAALAAGFQDLPNVPDSEDRLQPLLACFRGFSDSLGSGLM